MMQVQLVNKVSTCATFVAIWLAVFLSGCATTAPRATFTQALPKQQQIDKNDTVMVKVEAGQDVPIGDNEKQRLAQLTKQKIDAQKMNNTVAGDPHEYELEILVTRYERGNAFARFMLAGLGQIHIDGHVSVLSLPERIKVAQFDIDKTFAWGGIYGGTTGIVEVEEGFAQGVAEAVTKAE